MIALRVGFASRFAPRVGFEPTTNRLTVDRSTTELPRNVVLKEQKHHTKKSHSCNHIVIEFLHE